MLTNLTLIGLIATYYLIGLIVAFACAYLSRICRELYRRSFEKEHYDIYYQFVQYFDDDYLLLAVVTPWYWPILILITIFRLITCTRGYRNLIAAIKSPITAMNVWLTEKIKNYVEKTNGI